MPPPATFNTAALFFSCRCPRSLEPHDPKRRPGTLQPHAVGPSQASATPDLKSAPVCLKQGAGVRGIPHILPSAQGQGGAGRGSAVPYMRAVRANTVYSAQGPGSDTHCRPGIPSPVGPLLGTRKQQVGCSLALPVGSRSYFKAIF